MKIKGLLLALAGIGLAVIPVLADNYPVHDIPESCLTWANSVMRRCDIQYRLEPDGTLYKEITQAVTILNKGGEDEAIWYTYESSLSKVKTLKGIVYGPDGEIIYESNKNDVKTYGSYSDIEFSDARYLQLDLRRPSFPYTVEFSVKQSVQLVYGIDPLPLQQLGQSVQQANVTVQYPGDWPLKYKLTKTDITPEQTDQGPFKTLRWSFRDLPASPMESYHPFFRNSELYLLLEAGRIVSGNKIWETETWEKKGAYFYEINSNRDLLPAATLDTVRLLTEGKNTEQEKIAALYRFLQTHTRYVSIQIGIGGWQTITAATVDAKRYGDCKALTNYMQALLKAAGIPSWMALVYAGSDGNTPPLYEDIACPLFNHVILYIPGADTWLECTSSDHPAGYLGSFTANRPVLLLTPEGGKLDHTPALTETQNRRDSYCTVQLMHDGKAEIDYNARYSGRLQEYLRHTLVTATDPQSKEAYLRSLGLVVLQTHALEAEADATEPVTRNTFRLSVSAYAKPSGKRLFAPLFKLHPFEITLATDTLRQLPVAIRNASTQTDTVRILLPESYRVENIPPDLILEYPEIRYERQILSQEEGVVTAVRRITLKPISRPPEDYEDLRKQFDALIKADGAKLVLVR